MIKSLYPLIIGSVQNRQKKLLFFHYGESFFLSVMGLPLEERKCQNEEHFVDCNTRLHLENILENCGCLPMSIGSFTKNVKIL